MTAKQLLKKAIALNNEKKYPEVVELLADNFLDRYKDAGLYAEKAIAFWRLKQFNQCEITANKALEIDLENTKALTYKANVLSENKQFSEAEELYKKAIGGDTQYPHPYNGLGVLYYHLKEYYKAEDCFKKAVEKDPQFSYSYNGLAVVYSDLNQYDKAEEYYKKAIEKNPDSSYSYNGLGVLYDHLKQKDKAAEYYKQAIVKDAKYSPAYYNLGLLYKEQKNYYESLSYFSRALDLDHKDTDSYFQRAEVYRLLERNEEALEEYRKFISMSIDGNKYMTDVANEKIVELEKLLIGDAEYRKISKIVNEIKKLLLYEENCVTHYTSMSVAEILVLQPDSLFRLSEGAFLNDTSEGYAIFEHLPSLTEVHRKDGTKAKQFAAKPFIGSFVSENQHNDLTLWRMYGKEDKEEAKGCAITFDRNSLLLTLKEILLKDKKADIFRSLEDEFSFYLVAYRKQDGTFVIPRMSSKNDELNKLMGKLKDNVTIYRKRITDMTEKVSTNDKIRDVIILLNKIAYLFKSYDYQYEDEIRLRMSGTGISKELDDTSPPRVYINLCHIRSVITKITLGPKVEKADEWASAFYYSLDKDGLHPEIYISQLSFK